MDTSFIESLEKFTEPRDEVQLRILEKALGSVTPEECKPGEFEALLQIFERFPDEDGFGVFWSIVHLLEACDDYEPALIASVKRKPVNFNILMVNRLLNDGVTQVGHQSLIELLRSVENHPIASGSAKMSARHFLEYQSDRGNT